MRKYAYLKEPLRKDEYFIYKIMMYETEEGIYLFEYNHPEAILSSSDQLYLSYEDIYDQWNHRIDERGWIEIADPLPYCQHDAFMPIRVKGRNIGKPQWGEYEILIDGKWIEYAYK